MSMLFNTMHSSLPHGMIIKGKWNGKEYKIRRLIGSGENGTVYLVESNQGLYALKLSAESLEISHEIKMIMRLNKAQGSSLGFSVFDIDDFTYQGEVYTFYVMPYRQGASIERYLEKKAKKDYLHLFDKVIEKLMTFHQKGYVFGDLKPEHIVIDPNGQLSFIDFGGVTLNGEGVRQYTELYDRASWKAGNRIADSHYDLFSLAMIFVQLGMGKNKLLKIYNETRSLKEVYVIIRKIPSLELLFPILKEILQGKLVHDMEVRDAIERQEILKGIERRYDDWLNWLLGTSFLLFLFTSAYFIYQW